MLPVHKNALKRPYRLHLGYEFGTDPKENWSAQFERNKRGIQITDKTPAIVYYPNQNKPVYDPGTPPTPIGIDRFHKFGKNYRTVSPLHLSAQGDPVPDPASAHTIMDGYNDCKALVVLLDAAGLTNERVALIIFGGIYYEHCIFDSERIDVYGIGRPILTLTAPDFSPVITVTVDCTKIRIDGLEVINLGGEGYDWPTNCGIVVEEGMESGVEFSNIHITNCYFHGTATQAYFQRWVCVENSKFYSSDNYTNYAYDAYEASVVCRFCLSVPQTNWSQFVKCTISGQSNSGVPYQKGKAISVYAVEDDLSTWIINATTVGVYTPYVPGVVGPPAVPASGAVFASGFAISGVTLQWCEIIGWAENKGWALEYFNCEIIQGKYVNNTIGAVHLTAVCQTNDTVTPPTANIYSFTWFTGGAAKVTYLIQYTDTNGVTNTASNEVWINHFKHSSPKLAVGGSAMLVFGAGAPIGHMYGSFSGTSMQFWLNAGAMTQGANVTSNIARMINSEGYQNV